jgi:hypothetical protein
MYASIDHLFPEVNSLGGGVPISEKDVEQKVSKSRSKAMAK